MRTYPSLRQYSCVCLDGLKKTKKNISNKSRPTGKQNFHCQAR